MEREVEIEEFSIECKKCGSKNITLTYDLMIGI